MSPGAGARTVEFWFKAAGSSGSVPVLTYGGTSIVLRDSGEVAVASTKGEKPELQVELDRGLSVPGATPEDAASSRSSAAGAGARKTSSKRSTICTAGKLASWLKRASASISPPRAAS